MEIMKTENIVGICVETSINELTQNKEVFNCAILSINHYIVRIDVIEDGKRDRNNYSRKQLLSLSLQGLPFFAQSNLIKCPAP